MKKYFAIILAIIMLFVFVACSANKDNNESTTTTTTTATTTTSATSSNNENQNEKAESTSKKNDKESMEGLSNVRVEDINDVTNSDGSMNEIVIGTTGSNNGNSSDWGDMTTQHQGFETEEIPIG